MLKASIFNKLFIFELANNHSGDLKHGINIIREIGKACKKYDFKFGFKLQYRNLDTFIHPDSKGRADIKYVKRFEETRLSEKELKALKDEICSAGFMPICTPFDEKSVDLIEKHDFSVIKIGSCSFTDWPLLERIAQTDLPIIASTASATLEEIDQVVTFFEHRNKNLCIMHCVGEYPTKRDNLQLNQIDLLRERYPGIAVGFSTHEEPDNIDSIKIAIAKGAKVFERHVVIESKKYSINAYSSVPSQIDKWLGAAQDAYQMDGVEEGRYLITEKERNDLKGLKRGVFAKVDLKLGEKLTKDYVFYAIPCQEGQLVANDISKYIEYILDRNLKANAAVNFNDLKIRNLREKVLKIIKELKEVILKSHIALPEKIDLELSHHYGIDRYEEWGAAILNCINREYCKKLIIMLPGQKHPFHYHVKKEETFQVLYGSMDVTIGKEVKLLKAGGMLTVERGVNHDFSSKEGVIFEEVSTTHYQDDSFYEDKTISSNKDRKTQMTFRSDWLYEAIK
ncbi:MAG: N-acetylneuraminate synthase family protein [Candidatus Omnitrophota bacterium]|nr:N-acetylneuraminate synthase family protein [Candidatus Omnitrophota bacterium]